MIYGTSILFFIILFSIIFYIIPLIIHISQYFFYIFIVIFSLCMGFLFKFIFNRCNYKKDEAIYFSVLLSCIGVFYFSSLKIVEIVAKTLNLSFINQGYLILLRNFPDINLSFILFLISFNFIFIYKYIHSERRNYFHLLFYIIPIILYLIAIYLINFVYI